MHWWQTDQFPSSKSHYRNAKWYMNKIVITQLHSSNQNIYCSGFNFKHNLTFLLNFSPMFHTFYSTMYKNIQLLAVSLKGKTTFFKMYFSDVSPVICMVIDHTCLNVFKINIMLAWTLRNMLISHFTPPELVQRPKLSKIKMWCRRLEYTKHLNADCGLPAR